MTNNLTPTRMARVCSCGDHGFVHLTKGAVALFSPADIGKIAGAYWWAARRGRTVYAASGRGYMHRVILTSAQIIDHINGNGLDNRRENLRGATKRQNVTNSRPSRNGTSIYKGVHLSSYGGWVVQGAVGEDGKRATIGTFSCEVCAATTYDRYAIGRFGKFARTNKSLGLLPAQHDCPGSNPRSRTRSKLTEDAVRAILTSGASGPVLACQYGVDRSTISDIRRGKTWQHLREARLYPGPRPYPGEA